jgi:uncharacterized protein
MDLRSAAASTVTVLLLAGCASAVKPSAPASSPTTLPRLVTATGTGSAEGTPDLLTIVVGVETVGSGAQAALATNDTEAQAVISRLQADGVQPADLQTSQLSVNPDYSSSQRLTGFTVTDLVTAKIRQLAKAGQIIDDAVAAGGNDAQLESVQYSVADDGTLQSQARADAVTEATAEARAMAAAAGVGLGPVQSVTDENVPEPYEGVPAALATSSGGSPALPPVEAGSETVTVQVTVAFAVEDGGKGAGDGAA